MSNPNAHPNPYLKHIPNPNPCTGPHPDHFLYENHKQISDMLIKMSGNITMDYLMTSSKHTYCVQ